MRIFFPLFLLMTMLISCDEATDDLAPIKPILIKYGTSFGECLGYCKTETTLDQSSIEVIISKWDGDQKINTEEIASTTYDEVLAGINWSEFNQLQEVIGCPDCADGGAEWLELPVNGTTKRVTFEYMESIKGINEAIQLLRTLTDAHRPAHED